MNQTSKKLWIQLAHITALFSSLFILLLSNPTLATETEQWTKSVETNTETVNHNAWQLILDAYLIEDSKSGINLFKYHAVSKQDKTKLATYLDQLQAIDPLKKTKAEQKAYWINLYNALTVKLILDHYPTKSITKLGESIFSFGPWGDEIVTVNGEELSLNDIEHKILRPIFKDARIHYAVNCASYSCPNLSNKAYTSINTDKLLNEGHCDYVNHPRGVSFDGRSLTLSSIYDWYAEDFGNSKEDLVKHLLHCAQGNLKGKLETFLASDDDIDYDYNWNLNEIK